MKMKKTVYLILALVIVLIGLVGNNCLVNGILYGEWWKFW